MALRLALILLSGSSVHALAPPNDLCGADGCATDHVLLQLRDKGLALQSSSRGTPCVQNPDCKTNPWCEDETYITWCKTMGDHSSPWCPDPMCMWSETTTTTTAPATTTTAITTQASTTTTAAATTPAATTTTAATTPATTTQAATTTTKAATTTTTAATTPASTTTTTTAAATTPAPTTQAATTTTTAATTTTVAVTTEAATTTTKAATTTTAVATATQAPGTTPPALVVESTCVLWGEPHIRVFDHAESASSGHERIANIFTVGDFWIVRSDHVNIQGRYVATSTWSNDLAAVGAIAIGGHFLKNHTLIVESAEGQVTWDGEPILESLPSDFEAPGLLSASYREDADASGLDAKRQKKVAPRSVHLELPLGTIVTVNRWAQHVDVTITMRPQMGGQDGHCGNFNGDASDDTTDQIKARMGAPVPAEQLFFSPSSAKASLVSAGAGSSSSSSSRARDVTLEDCQADKRASAEELCDKAQLQDGSSMISREACVWDVCFGGEDYALADAVVEQQLEQEAPPRAIRLGGEQGKCLSLYGGQPLNGSALELQTCEAEKPEMQFLLPEGGVGQIRWALHPKMCLDVAGGALEVGTRIQLWECQAGHNNMAFGIPAGGRGQIRWQPHQDRCLSIVQAGEASWMALSICDHDTESQDFVTALA